MVYKLSLCKYFLFAAVVAVWLGVVRGLWMNSEGHVSLPETCIPLTSILCSAVFYLLNL